MFIVKLYCGIWQHKSSTFYFQHTNMTRLRHVVTFRSKVSFINIYYKLFKLNSTLINSVPIYTKLYLNSCQHWDDLEVKVTLNFW